MEKIVLENCTLCFAYDNIQNIYCAKAELSQTNDGYLLCTYFEDWEWSEWNFAERPEIVCIDGEFDIWEEATYSTAQYKDGEPVNQHDYTIYPKDSMDSLILFLNSNNIKWKMI